MEHFAKLFEYRASTKRLEGLRELRYALAGSEADQFLTRFATILQAPRLVIGNEVISSFPINPLLSPIITAPFDSY